MIELQDELMTIRLREAETQAEIKEIKQRMMEMETQVWWKNLITLKTIVNPSKVYAQIVSSLQ